MRSGRRSMPVSADEGKTWKKRWISTTQFNPEFSELNVGELVKVGEAIHKVVIRNGRLDCPLVKCADDEHDWDNSAWYKQCKKCTFRVDWIFA